ncbi:T9SS C-terminal target domain-containing protein [Aquimarina sp. AD10]|uniref:M36 family metallopeptidase n=1 Tax=Aquimarina sp. AD10 TaxID=1714849 RepID=UPI000E4CB24D|nr:M36 family metallopeptidase [Aquimarina sp. AD10]AXT60291.1 T9SS C-terminal target domain-containing protein [Aquimarina sp. AD10]RKN01274.1 T9SS C-terminal target domain-containing protein [Aquimarina sp. AD10]
MKKVYSFAVLILLIGQTLFAQQDIETAVLNHFKAEAAAANDAKSSTTNDYSEFKITSTASSLKPGLVHAYITQYLNGTPIVNGTYKVSVENGQVTYAINQFVQDAASKVVAAKSSSTPETAIGVVARMHNLAQPKSLSKAVIQKNGNDVFEFKNSGITEDEKAITAKQVYVYHNNELRLAWNVNLYEKGGENWWDSYVDISTNEILHENNWVISCNFDAPGHESHDHNESVLIDANKIGPLTKAATAALAPDSYNVYAMPLGSPDEGNRSIVTDPANTTASPFGWHDTNGSAGAEFTITRGNNVWAQDDSNGNNGTGFSPSGGSSLDFSFPVNLNQAPSNYRDASITNLFYWNNIMHDVWYQYGFDEASGNFQENNYGNGGSGSDSVNADAQDGSGTNNANFGTPPDGSNPRMQMFLWNRTNPGRDGSFDNIIIAHEYGHGISTRLVGGRNSNTLGGSEQMGEGWSDWFGLMLTMKAGDRGTDGRGVGPYVLGQPVDGAGIRPTRYSTNRSINNTDYADIGGLARPHGVGYAFATILWDMTWALIDQEGFNPDFYNGTGGNNIAMALVIEGLKNTANNPGFVSGRDGILQADQDLYNGQYRCLIWKAFAERGVGQDANENNNGGSNGQTDQTVSFVNPCDGGGPGPGGDDCTGDVTSFPFAESFETNLGLWKDATSGDDLNFTRNSGGTPSNGTGPSSAVDGSTYIYVEASGNGTGFPNKRAILNSPCLNFSGLTSPSLTFQYHMVGSAIESLTVEARTDNTGNWVSVFNRAGAQGTNWNAADVDLSAYAGNASVQLRFNVLTGDGGQGWQSDIAIDAVSIQDGTGNPDPTCDALSFNDFTISPFSNQDTATGNNATVINGGAGLSMSNNTWKFIALNYTVTANTVIEFDFSSTAQGEIHAVGFEDDNTLTQTRYFKVHGTQSYGVLDFDNYAGGTTTYTIPVGNFYTGSMDRLVFINDNDAGSGNTSVFSNVKIYEGSCPGSSVVASFGPTTPTLGTENEGAFAMRVHPNPLSKGSSLQVSISGKQLSETPYSIINIMGQVVGKGKLNNSGSINVSRLGAGMYILKVQDSTQRFIIQ